MTAPSSRNVGQAGLHVRYEKAGLILDALPIPWNADAVIVEANVRLPTGTPPAKHDFTLRLSTDVAPIAAEILGQQSKNAPVRVFFRIPVPLQSCSVQVYWREHSLGNVELPIVAQATFEDGFALEMPTVHVMLGGRTVACRAFVTTQAKNLLVSAVVRSAVPLAAALNMGLRVEIHRANGQSVASAVVPFTSEQLRTRQTLVSVQMPKLRTIGTYEVSWYLADRCLNKQRIRTVSKKTLLRSLRISATRFHVTMDDGTNQTVRSLPTRDGQLLLDGIAQVAPILFVCSGEAGMAGLVPFTLRALIGDLVSTAGSEKDVLVTDGPTPIILGVLSAAALSQAKHFTLIAGETSLGNLPLLPAPTADFTGEGGFAALDDYLWSSAAEEQLNERLGKLLDGG